MTGERKPGEGEDATLKVLRPHIEWYNYLQMKTVQVSLPEKSSEFVEAQAAKSGYRDAGEYLAALVEQERARAIREELEQQLVTAVNSPSSPMTAADWDDIRREGRRIIEERRGR